MKDLVEKSVKGDKRAFVEMVEHNAQKLYRIALSYMKNEHDAVEAVQETTYRAFKNTNKLKTPEYFDTWIVRILINYCKSELKKRKRDIPLGKREIPHGEQHNLDEKLTVEKAVDKLPQSYRETVILRYYEDMKIKDIAKIMKCPEGTVKGRINRALSKLEKQMSKGGAIK